MFISITFLQSTKKEFYKNQYKTPSNLLQKRNIKLKCRLGLLIDQRLSLCVTSHQASRCSRDQNQLILSARVLLLQLQTCLLERIFENIFSKMPQHYYFIAKTVLLGRVTHEMCRPLLYYPIDKIFILLPISYPIF